MTYKINIEEQRKRYLGKHEKQKLAIGSLPHAIEINRTDFSRTTVNSEFMNMNGIENDPSLLVKRDVDSLSKLTEKKSNCRFARIYIKMNIRLAKVRYTVDLSLFRIDTLCKTTQFLL